MRIDYIYYLSKALDQKISIEKTLFGDLNELCKRTGVKGFEYKMSYCFDTAIFREGKIAPGAICHVYEVYRNAAGETVKEEEDQSIVVNINDFSKSFVVAPGWLGLKPTEKTVLLDDYGMDSGYRDTPKEMWNPIVREAYRHLLQECPYNSMSEIVECGIS